MICPILFARFRIFEILSGSCGNFGAGGKIGSSKLIWGRRLGNSGRFGGSGNNGISGSSKSRSNLSPIDGGVGRFGILGNSILSGTKLNFGSVISIPRLILERSIIRFGSFIFGIGSGSTFNPQQRKLNLHAYWSYASWVQVPHLAVQFAEKSSITW